MIKASAHRSIARRIALTKVASGISVPSKIPGGFMGNTFRAQFNTTPRGVTVNPPPQKPVQPVQSPAPAQHASVMIPGGGRSVAGYWWDTAKGAVGNAASRAATSAAEGLWRGIEWGSDWPTHLKNWYKRTFGVKQ